MLFPTLSLQNLQHFLTQTDPEDVILAVLQISLTSTTVSPLTQAPLKLSLLFSLQNYHLFLNNLFQSTSSPPDPSWFSTVLPFPPDILLLKPFVILSLVLSHSLLISGTPSLPILLTVSVVVAVTSCCHACS